MSDLLSRLEQSLRQSRAARMHLAARSYSGFLENPRGPKWWRVAAREVRPFLQPQHLELLEGELAFQAAHRFPDLTGNLGNIALLKMAAGHGLVAPELAKLGGSMLIEPQGDHRVGAEATSTPRRGPP